MKKQILITILLLSATWSQAQISNDSLLNRIKENEQYMYKSSENFQRAINDISLNLRKSADESEIGLFTSFAGGLGLVGSTAYYAFKPERKTRDIKYAFLISGFVFLVGEVILFDATKHKWAAGKVIVDNNGLGISLRMPK